MTNLEFLKYLRENRIVFFEDNIENVFFIWDSDGWHKVLIYFDKEGNVIE